MVIKSIILLVKDKGSNEMDRANKDKMDFFRIDHLVLG